nr:MAG TPA: hypothetical protein [Caudoviricetes sp.]
MWRGLYIGACSCVPCPVFPLLLLCVCVSVGHCRGLAPCPGFIGVYFIDSGGGLCQ